MKCLSIQIQPDRVPQLDVSEVVRALTELVADASVAATVDMEQGNEDGRYINVFWTTHEYLALWKVLQQHLERDPQLSNCSMVCCEGDHGWDDYVLLHHYDPVQALDERHSDEAD